MTCIDASMQCFRLNKLGHWRGKFHFLINLNHCGLWMHCKETYFHRAFKHIHSFLHYKYVVPESGTFISISINQQCITFKGIEKGISTS